MKSSIQKKMTKHFSKVHLNKIASISISAAILGTLFSLERLPRINEANASSSMMEFRWNDTSKYKKLYYWQSASDRRARATYYLVMRPNDRRTAILKLKVSLPEHFDGYIPQKQLKLCQVSLGGMLTKTRCNKQIPAVFELGDKQSFFEVFPETPIPSDKASYALVMKIFNPSKAGMFQMNAIAQAPGDVPISSYLGSWNIDID